jgi:hypothetical protein
MSFIESVLGSRSGGEVFEVGKSNNGGNEECWKRLAVICDKYGMI